MTASAQEAARRICIRYQGHSGQGIIDEMAEIIDAQFAHYEEAIATLNREIANKDQCIWELKRKEQAATNAIESLVSELNRAAR